ncbi:hypothetical protein FRZ67_07590 [Panacibacter ginsenosidivorans]|uniref:Uncharacterized protein n=1 Tax=Panacibacter ginsenosidivorans TaxID=1813871 RepID=A0A5B8V8K0_9BACT|nr:hypothetical protein [Panacibacter ginsenosidivorans]QEC67161.1 hypothetical protein FRZ67_07590 [Panacibacter ginsenosidivorans]
MRHILWSKMNTSKKLKIWTIITQAFILVGFGHGILFFLIIEILWFPYFNKEHFSFDLNASFENHLPVAGLLTLLGQCAFIISILLKNYKIKMTLQILGFVLFWVSIFYFVYNIEESPGVHFATITFFPFVISTIIAFAGKPISKFYKYIFKK